MTRRAVPTLEMPAPGLVQPSSPSLTIYLLHAHRPVRNARHYLGITRTDRLAKRVREHAHRRGSSLTAQLAAINDELLLARTWQDVSWEEERRMKQAGHYARLCPICPKMDAEQAILRIPCPDLAQLRTLGEYVALGATLRPVHGQTTNERGRQRH